ncbi:uncharacterized protein [Diabrotica undecimpunctata]|uniref:uncharacterized protein n=1 Tax=Diabrotica undecimpunctata TaxID=50387 RepID=UPI003B642563
MHLFIDTGATRSFIRAGFLNEKLQPTTTNLVLETASGHTIPIHGGITATIQIGNTLIKHIFLVADIKDDCVLGMDIMQNKFIIDLQNKILLIENEEIVLNLKESVPQVRVIVSEDTEIPQNSESTILARLSQKSEGLHFGVVESDELVSDGILIARCLINVDEIIPVRFANLSKKPFKLKKEQQIPFCKPIEKISKCEKYLKKNTASRNPVDASLVKQLIKNVDHLPTKQLNKINEFFNENYDIFDSEKSTVRTSLVQHGIYTGDARPIRQAPRRLPFVRQKEVENIIQDMINADIIEEASAPAVHQ